MLFTPFVQAIATATSPSIITHQFCLLQPILAGICTKSVLSLDYSGISLPRIILIESGPIASPVIDSPVTIDSRSRGQNHRLSCLSCLSFPNFHKIWSNIGSRIFLQDYTIRQLSSNRSSQLLLWFISMSSYERKMRFLLWSRKHFTVQINRFQMKIVN